MGGTTTGEMLDQFKNELPQTTPWKENVFKYSLNSTLGISKRIALVSRIGFVKVSRSDYQENPDKEIPIKVEILVILEKERSRSPGLILSGL